MSKVRLAIVGVGNCASSFVQGLEYYKDASTEDHVPGLMHVDLAGYHIRDIEVVAAFDVDAKKVGQDVSDAIFSEPNNTIRFAADVPPTSSAARDKLVASGEPSGDLGVPTVTLHNIDDPLAIAANETVLHGLVAARDHTNQLEQLFVGPYGEAPTFGLGHCFFSIGEEVGLIDTLDQWVRQGARPAPTEIASFLGPALDRSYSSPKWPSGVVD